jgi:competence protein ComEC
MVLGGLWLALWTSRVRLWGLVPLALGAAGAAAAPVPALRVNRDGRPQAVVRAHGTPVLLRAQAGDFMRDLMAESAAFDGDPLALEAQDFARCTRDACVADLVRDGHAWRLLAIRSRDRIEWASLVRACADADIVVADRRLPRRCAPRWLKLDRASLERTGGVTQFLGAAPEIRTVSGRVQQHPWRGDAKSTTAATPPYPAGARNAAIRDRT